MGSYSGLTHHTPFFSSPPPLVAKWINNFIFVPFSYCFKLLFHPQKNHPSKKLDKLAKSTSAASVQEKPKEEADKKQKKIKLTKRNYQLLQKKMADTPKGGKLKIGFSYSHKAPHSGGPSATDLVQTGRRSTGRTLGRERAKSHASKGSSGGRTSRLSTSYLRSMSIVFSEHPSDA